MLNEFNNQEKIAFVFPGQGAQYVGMGKDLYENNELAKRYFNEIFAELSENKNLDLKDIMFNGPEEKLKETLYTQPALVAFSLVLTKLLEEKGVKANFTAGHSVGEYAALGAASYLSLSDTVQLTSERAKAMQSVNESVQGTMAAIIGLDSEEIVKILSDIDGVVEAVNFNEPKQTVIAGDVSSVTLACEKLKEAGARRAMVLNVSGPFHSSLMKPAGENLKKVLDEISFNLNPSATLIANTTANAINNEGELKEELYKQIFGPVKWVETINKLKDNGVTKIYEIGAGKVLKGLIRKIDKSIEVINIETLEDLMNL